MSGGKAAAPFPKNFLDANFFSKATEYFLSESIS